MSCFLAIAGEVPWEHKFLLSNPLGKYAVRCKNKRMLLHLVEDL